MMFLGTAAADAMPNPFCDCPICVDARLHPQRQRMRSMFQLDAENLIDCGPDLAATCMRWSVNLSSLKNIFLTHTHEDHFCSSNAGLLRMSCSRNSVPVDVYLSASAYDTLLRLRTLLGNGWRHMDAVKAFDHGLVRLHPVTVFEPFVVDGQQILPVRTTHRASETETAINYLIQRANGKKLLYACDTGIYPEDTLEALQNSAVDTLVMEATFGSRTDNDTSSHLNCEAFLKMLELLTVYGVIRKDTKVFATHINHKHDFTHDLMQKWFDERAAMPVTVACDGLCAERGN